MLLWWWDALYLGILEASCAIVLHEVCHWRKLCKGFRASHYYFLQLHVYIQLPQNKKLNLPVFPESFSHCPVPLLFYIAQLLKTIFISPLLNPLHPSLCPPVWWKTTLPRSLVNSQLCPSLGFSASYCASTLPSGPTIPWPSGSSSHSPLLTPSPLPSLCLEPSLPRFQSQGFRHRPLWRCLSPIPTFPELRLPPQLPLRPCSSLPGGSVLARLTFSGWLRALLTQRSLSFSYVPHPVPLNISQILLLAPLTHVTGKPQPTACPLGTLASIPAPGWTSTEPKASVWSHPTEPHATDLLKDV